MGFTKHSFQSHWKKSGWQPFWFTYLWCFFAATLVYGIASLVCIFVSTLVSLFFFTYSIKAMKWVSRAGLLLNNFTLSHSCRKWMGTWAFGISVGCQPADFNLSRRALFIAFAMQSQASNTQLCICATLEGQSYWFLSPFGKQHREGAEGVSNRKVWALKRCMCFWTVGLLVEFHAVIMPDPLSKGSGCKRIDNLTCVLVKPL